MFTSRSKIGAMIAAAAASAGFVQTGQRGAPEAINRGAPSREYIPKYGSYSRFREQFRDDEARIQAAAERRERRAKRNGYVYTPPAQLRRERNRGRSHARYIR